MEQSNLLGWFVSYEENGMLWIRPRIFLYIRKEKTQSKLASTKYPQWWYWHAAVKFKSPSTRATTGFSVTTTLSIAFGLMTLSMMSFGIITLSTLGLFGNLSVNDTRVNSALTLCWVSLCLMLRFSYCYAECRYAECHYAECHYAECHGAVSVTEMRKVIELVS